jgi:SprT protein
MTSQIIWDGPFITLGIDVGQQRMNKMIDPLIAVEPIDARQQSQVFSATLDCIQRAGAIYRLDLSPIPVRFDLKGKAAGQYRLHRNERCIRYNPYLFAKYFDDSLVSTVPHEVAHYVTDCLYGLRNVRPHGAEWRAVMESLGADPSATNYYDLTGIPVRRQQRFTYHCACSTHQLSSCRHNKIRRGKAGYLCRRCGSSIVLGMRTK